MNFMLLKWWKDVSGLHRSLVRFEALTRDILATSSVLPGHTSLWLAVCLDYTPGKTCLLKSFGCFCGYHMCGRQWWWSSSLGKRSGLAEEAPKGQGVNTQRGISQEPVQITEGGFGLSSPGLLPLWNHYLSEKKNKGQSSNKYKFIQNT